MNRRPSLFAPAVAGLVLGVLWGCGLASPTKELEKGKQQREQAAVASSAATGSDNPGIRLHCAVEHIQKTPAPFHWSFKKIVTPDTNADWEADVTPDAIGGTLIDSSGTRAIHGVRSDQTSWNTAVMILSGPLPASTFALVDNSSATVRAGTEAMNGENAIRYEIDTSRESAADAYLIKSMLGANGSIRGAVWVTRDGCPVKFILDVQQSLRDGSVQQEHYEENATQP